MDAQPQLLHAREAFYRRDRRSARLAREFTREALTDWGTAERSDDVLLCVSELATNAVLHGVPPGRGFRLQLALDTAGVVRIEVHDSGPGEVRPPDPDTEAEDGRGLLLVAALADKWGVGERDPGKVVWCEFAVRKNDVPASNGRPTAGP
ncbi:ATP-binding protein [Streptomyces ureilyticus]|uniref:ATP-binding protein n=1 Tax=Streptomyces ureilyticus TaxID=1775131 RepID=A0ABX0DSK7_9ACTN|nr:ATP-binding protein [Streptomyces ureilyticus]NGO43283.1 ATP-binding protein [Streptomyces ureilyticus]